MSTKLRSIEVLRLANECLVGQYPDRVVPTFVFHQFAAPLFEPDGDLVHLISTLAFNPNWCACKSRKIAQIIPSVANDQAALVSTMQGLLNPDRRLFLANATKTATVGSSNTFPLIAGLIIRGGADEGLGRRCFRVLKHFHPDSLQILINLLSPEEAFDPVTALALTLSGDQRRFVEQDWCNRTNEESTEFTEFDKNCADFLKNLISSIGHAGRIYAIRDLEIGLQFIGLLQMTSGFVARCSGTIPNIFVYGGMPPGPANDMRVRFSSSSFSEWISGIWRSIGERLKAVIESYPSLPNEAPAKVFFQQLRIALVNQKTRDKDLRVLLEAVSGFLDEQDDDWTIFDLLEDALNFPPSELARRVRALGQSIGFTAPDRGEGSVRLVLDTPLLNVLIRGAIGNSTMNFEDFISSVSRRFGLVIGPGSDDSVMASFNGQPDAGVYELLLLNQDSLQERLLRAGFARAYSDSHTEVLPHSLS